MGTIEKIRQVQLVGRKIRQLRKEHKLTQVELSARLGIQQSDLSRMEQGEYRVSLDTLFRILTEFKMSIGEFFEGVAQESITPRDVQLVQEFNSLPRDAQREVEDFIAFKRVQSGTEREKADGTRRDGADSASHRPHHPEATEHPEGTDTGQLTHGSSRRAAGLRQPMA